MPKRLPSAPTQKVRLDGSRVQAPVLMIIGDADPDWKDPQAEAAWAASNFAGAKTVAVHGAGHAPMLERPEIVNPAVSEFVDALGLKDALKARNA